MCGNSCEFVFSKIESSPGKAVIATYKSDASICGLLSLCVIDVLINLQSEEETFNFSEGGLPHGGFLFSLEVFRR